MSFVFRGFRRAASLALLFVASAFSSLSHGQSIPYTCPTQLQLPAPYHITMLNLPAAWARSCGSGYVAAIDNGVKVANPKLGPNVRTRFSRSFNSSRPEDLVNLNENAVNSGLGHGNHVSGLIAAIPDSNNNAVGACPGCSLLMFGGVVKLDGSQIVSAYQSGAQVINMSFSTDQTGHTPDPGDCAWSSSGGYQQSFCDALDQANQREVLVIAASGNEAHNAVGFPASHLGVVPIGGVKDGVGGFWVADLVADKANDPGYSFGSNWGTGQTLVAPARSISSTFLTNGVWHQFYVPNSPNPFDAVSCKWTGADYGLCSGTSQAAPLISGLAGIIRSANPWLTTLDVRHILEHRSVTVASVHNGEVMPDSDNAVLAALAGVTGSQSLSGYSNLKNRRIPLLSLYSSDAQNHFYTVVPQMALAALTGTMEPLPRWVISPLMKSKVTATFVCGQSGTPPCNALIPIAPTDLPAGQRWYLTTADGQVRAGESIYGTVSYLDNQDHTTIHTNKGQAVSFGGTGEVQSFGINWSNVATNGEHDVTVETAGTEPLFYDNVGEDVSLILPTCGFSPQDPYCNIKAVASVFSTHVNPLGGSNPDLVPLYRMSWRCGEGDPNNQTTCATVPNHVSHAYTTSSTGVNAFAGVGYVLDGIEGFIYPTTQSPQPAGTVKLCRRYSSARDDYRLYLGSGTNGADCAPVPDPDTGGTYDVLVGGTDWIGYVLPVEFLHENVPYYQVGVPASMSIIAGSGQSTQAGTAFAQQLIVAVFDGNQNPAANASVTFSSPASGAGTNPVSTVATTNAQGLAVLSAVANNSVGTYNVTASASGVAPLTFVLTNVLGPPSAFTAESGSGQSTGTGSAFDAPLVARITDSAGNGIPGIAVAFTAPGTGASAAVTTTVNTDSTGRASTTATANGTDGSYTVTASAASTGLPNVSFSLTNAIPQPTTIELRTGNAQTAFINTQFATALKVRLKDQFTHLMPNATVTFTAPGSGATAVLSGATVSTDAFGEASVTATANGLAGTYQVTASVGALTPVSFSLTNTTEPDPTLTNGGFEAPAFTGNGGAVATGWTGTASGTYTNAGLTANGGLAAPEGTQAAWLTFGGGNVKQSRNLMAGSYTLTFKALSKLGVAAVPLTIKLNGVVAGTITPSNTAWTTYSVTMPHVPTGSNEFQFVSANSGTNRMFLDNVVLTRDPSVTDFSNGSFENPVVASSGGAPTGWTAGTTVSNTFLNSISTANTTDGTQGVYFSATTQVKQTIVLEPGLYNVVFKAIMRTGQVATTLNLFVDGVVKGTVTVNPSAWAEYTVPIAIPDRGGYEFAFQEQTGVSRPMIVDNVRLLPATASGLQNGGFETPVAPGGNTATLAAPWVATGSALVAGNANLASFGVPAAPEGVQALRYATSGSAKQSVNLMAGAYTLTFWGVARPITPVPPIIVKLNGVQVASFTPSTTTWTQYTVQLPQVPTGPNEIMFASVNTTSSTLFVDNVTLTAVPTLAAFQNGGFESPYLNGALTGAGADNWTGATRISSTQAVNLGLSAPPEGVQIGVGNMTQAVTLDPGFYHLTAKSAVRPAIGSATLELWIDGVQKGSTVVATSSWTDVSFPVVISQRGTYSFNLKATQVYLDNAAINLD